jgi:hypothetical protein
MTTRGLPNGNGPVKLAGVTDELSTRMADELRRRGYTVTPPHVVDLPDAGRLLIPVSLLSGSENPDPIFDAMLREALGLPADS